MSDDTDEENLQTPNSKIRCWACCRGTLQRALRHIGLAQGGRSDEGKNLTHAPYALAPAVPGECNRECLYQFVDKFFDAMLSRCRCNLADGPEAKYTENEMPVKLGEGMWKTFSGRGTYRVYLADPASGEVGYYGNVTEDSGRVGRRDRGADEDQGSPRRRSLRQSRCASRSDRRAGSA